MASSTTCCEAIWIHRLKAWLIDDILESTIFNCDNQSCIRIFENPIFHNFPKHIDI